MWSRPEAVEQTSYAVAVATETINFYEQYFTIPFPLRKQGEVGQYNLGRFGQRTFWPADVLASYFFTVFLNVSVVY